MSALQDAMRMGRRRSPPSVPSLIRSCSASSGAPEENLFPLACGARAFGYIRTLEPSFSCMASHFTLPIPWFAIHHPRNFFLSLKLQPKPLLMVVLCFFF